MTYLFYSFTFFAILYEMFVLSSPKQVHYFVEDIKRKTKEKLELNGKDYFYIFFGLIYFLWAWVGIFSSQYQLFLLLIIFGLIPRKIVFIRFIDAFISIIIIILIVISKYHYTIKLF